jgi:hypothetical protein
MRHPGPLSRIFRHHEGAMKLYAISDLHVGFEPNRDLWSALGDHRDDWLAGCLQHHV